MQKSLILKIALFATGLSGIVAEYILSTLASYFLGDSILQWTLVLSFMLFSMGLGSHLSRHFKENLLEKFIVIELALSTLVGFSALFVYTVAAFTAYTGAIIYVLSVSVGLMIGLEIPLVTRLNEEYEELRYNISSVMKYDYYGSLAGGIFFAFVGLPYLGLTFTPFVLAMVNFGVAMWLYIKFYNLALPKLRYLLNFLSLSVFTILILGAVFAKPIIFFGEQKRYKDQIIYEEQSKYQKIVITQWKEDYWLFINGSQQFSTLDEVMYHEPLVHPVMKMTPNPQNILILGGGDGLAVREILKYPSVKEIIMVDLDPAMTNLGKNHPILKYANQNSMHSPKLKVYNRDGYKFLDDSKQFFDAIIIDLPDPRTVELGRLYSKEFYMMCHKRLRPNGLVITQSGSPYYSTRAFTCIRYTLESAGFEVVPLHNQILTLGEWGWNIGSKSLSKTQLKQALQRLDFKDIQTKWLNHEAMQMMTSFGKETFFLSDSANINTIHNPVLYKYYLRGNWDLY